MLTRPLAHLKRGGATQRGARPVLHMPDAEGTVVTGDGTEVAWTSTGTGRPIVFVHGITLDGHIWYLQRDALAAGHRVVTLDQRGHGRSSPTAGLTTTGFLGDDLAAVIEGLDLWDAVVVGHSLGGMAALQCMTDHPELHERVAGMVLVSTTGTFRVATHAWLPVLSRLPGPVESVERIGFGLAARMIPSVLHALMRSRSLGRLATRFVIGPEAEEPAVAGTHAAIALTPTSVLRHILVGMAGYHVHEELTDLQIPVLVVCGSLDFVTPLPLSKLLADALPDAHLVVLDGTGHMPMWEVPDDLNTLLENWVAELPEVGDAETRAARVMRLPGSA